MMPALSPITGRRTALHLRGLMVGVAIAGLGLSVALFVIFPRGFGEGLMSVQSGRQTGYTDEVSLTDGT
ncbi:MAG: hypothetical protein GTO74_12510, partial [Hydrogenophaga sp.]|uniref:hypothetical protein n=1 Tax=Hydrogenophaga sp. TaxID=1904254 RepID=UPI001691A9ED